MGDDLRKLEGVVANPIEPPPSAGGDSGEGSPAPAVDPVASGEDARAAATTLATLGSPATSPIPANLGKREVERFVEQIVPAIFRDRSRLVREICREVMGKQPYERGRHLVPTALRHTLPLFLSDARFIATLSSEPLRLALDPKQPRAILEHNRRVILEQAVAFMGTWNPDAIQKILESPADLSGVLVFNVYPAVIDRLRRHDTESKAQATAEEVEREVEALIDRWIHPLIILPPGVERPREVTFLGKKYRLGQDDVNGIINNILDSSGSGKRFFIFPMLGEHCMLVYGTPVREQKIGVFGRKLRVIEMETPEIVHDVKTGTRGFNDSLSTVIILRERIETSLKRALSPSQSDPSYARPQKKIREWIRSSGGVTPDRIRMTSELIQTHELGHMTLQQAYGFEYVTLRDKLEKMENDTLTQFDEAYCDVFILERILRMASSDSERAREAFCLWSTLRGGSNILHEQIIQAILVAAASFEENNFEIDWARLATLTQSFKKFLHGIFAQIVFHMEIGLLDSAREDDPADVRRDYLDQKRQLAEHLASERSGENRSSFLLEHLAGAVIAHHVLDQKDNLGRLKRETFSSDMKFYERLLDDWMRENLGLTDSEVPIGAPPIGSTFVVGAGGVVAVIQSATPDPKVTASFAKPEFPIDTSDGYGDQSRWGSHLQKSREAISFTARMVLESPPFKGTRKNRPTVLVLGAGPCEDIPLRELVREWNAVLVDTNPEYLRGAVQGVPDQNRAHVSTVRKDLTGNVGSFLRAEIRRIVERADNREEAADQLVDLFDRLTVPIPFIDDDASADFIVSSMVVSQLLQEATETMLDALRQRGWRLPGDLTLYAWLRLKGRVQRAHVKALAEFVERTGKPVYLASEVVEIPRGATHAIDPEGRLFNKEGKPLPHLVNLLDGLNVDLLPVDEWEWDFDGSDKTYYVEALLIVPKGTAVQWRNLATKVPGTRPTATGTTLPLTPVPSAKQPADRQGRGNDGPTRAAGGLVVEMRDRRPVVEGRARFEVEGSLALSVIPATNEELGRESRSENFEQRVDRKISEITMTGSPLQRVTRGGDDTEAGMTSVRIKLISLARERGIEDVAALLARLTDQQLVTVLKTSRLWKKILERNGLGDRVPSIREEKISAADRLFLALAGLSRSRRDVAEILARIQSGQETNPPISPVIGIPAGIAGMARGGNALPIVR